MGTVCKQRDIANSISEEKTITSRGELHISVILNEVKNLSLRERETLRSAQGDIVKEVILRQGDWPVAPTGKCSRHAVLGDMYD